jgi:MFS family permease
LDRSLAFWVVGAALFVGIMANNLPSPLYSIYRSEWDLSALSVTGIFAVAAAAVLPTLIAFGAVSNRVGRRPVLLLSIALVCASDLVFFAARSPAWLYVGRLLAGAGIGLVAGTAVAAMGDLDSDHDHAARIAALATVSGQAVAPLFSGLLAEYAPEPTKLVFIVDLCVLCAVFVSLLFIPETVADAKWRVAAAWRPEPRLGVPTKARSAFVLAALAAFGAFAVMGVIAALGPTFAAQVLHEANRAIGGGIIFALLAVSALAQIGGKRASVSWCLRVGPVMLALGLGVILLAKPTGSVAVFVAGIAIAGGGPGLSYLGGQRLLDQNVDPSSRAAAFASFFVVLYVATAAGALGVGLLATVIDFYSAVVGVAVVVIALAMVTLAVGSRSPLLSAPRLGVEVT